MLFANAVAGDYTGKVFICNAMLWSGPSADKFEGINFEGKIKYMPSQIKRVVPLSSEQTTSFAGSAMTGLAGALLLGGAGLVAGAIAGGKKSMQKIGIEFTDQRKVVLEVSSENKGFKCLMLYAQANKLTPEVSF